MTQQISMKEFELSNVPFADLTLPPSQRESHLGGEYKKKTGSIDFRKLCISLGDRPISWKLQSLYKKAHGKFPEGLELFDEFDVWMITHTVSVIDRGEFSTFAASSVEAVGYEAEFERALVYNIGLLPNPEVISNIGGKLEVSVNLGLGGEVKLANIGEDSLIEGEILTGGAHLSSRVDSEFVGRLKFSVWTPKISSTGICSSRCEWLFNRVDRPLLNSQLMFQVAVVPAGLKKLKFRIRGYTLIRSIGWIPIPSRFETDWLDVSTSPIGTEIEKDLRNRGQIAQ